MRLYKGLVMVLLVLVVGGCTSASKISTDQVKAFITDVKKEIIVLCEGSGCPV